MLRDVVHVQACPDFSLILDFDTGERRLFNMSPYIDEAPWLKLKLKNGFLAAFVENGTVVWPGNVDIDPETLYELSVPI